MDYTDALEDLLLLPRPAISPGTNRLRCSPKVSSSGRKREGGSRWHSAAVRCLEVDNAGGNGLSVSRHARTHVRGTSPPAKVCRSMAQQARTGGNRKKTTTPVLSHIWRPHEPRERNEIQDGEGGRLGRERWQGTPCPV